MYMRFCGIAFALLTLLAAPSCDEEAAQYMYGVDLTTLEFNLYTANMGIHPDVSVMSDPNNPFVDSVIGADNKWVVNNFGGSIAAFYCWATILSQQPTGEHQYYAAFSLRDIWENELASSELLPFVKQMAIRAFQAVLDHFPESVSYDVTGVFSFPMAPLAYEAIEAMGGIVQGGWLKVSTPDGGSAVIQTSEE